MKRVAAVVGICILTIGAVLPKVADAGYFTAGLGLAQPEDHYTERNFGVTQWEFDKSGNLSFACGGAVKSFRLEGEFSYRKLDFEGRVFVPTGTRQNFGGDQTQFQIMFNGMYQIMPRWRVSPVVGAGVGFLRVSWNDVNMIIDDADIVFAYQVIAGLSVRLHENFFIDGRYTYVVPDDVSVRDKFGTVGKMDNQELNIITLGIRVGF